MGDLGKAMPDQLDRRIARDLAEARVDTDEDAFEVGIADTDRGLFEEGVKNRVRFFAFAHRDDRITALLVGLLHRSCLAGLYRTLMGGSESRAQVAKDSLAETRH